MKTEKDQLHIRFLELIFIQALDDHIQKPSKHNKLWFNTTTNMAREVGIDVDEIINQYEHAFWA